MYRKEILFFLSLFCFVSSITSHGFSAHTYVRAGSGLQSMQQVCFHVVQSKICISSYDFNTGKRILCRVSSTAQSKVNYYVKLSFEGGQSDISCTPTQLFYNAEKKEWVLAYLLQSGDMLLNGFGQAKRITAIELVKDPLTVYCLEIDNTHTFLVGRHAIITHNMVLPALTMGLNVAFGSGAAAGGTVASCFGPVAIVGGIALGGVVGIVTKLVSGCDRLPKYKIDFAMCEIEKQFNRNNFLYNDKIEDAQAPGKPTENDGFIPKKKWDGKKVRHSKTGQVGYPDKKGNVWVSTGPGPLAHRGPHWDVIDPKGRHKNVLPGGKVC